MTLASTITSGAMATFVWALCIASALGQPITFHPLPALEETPADQVALGKMLFFDPRLSGDATISCATCHQPDKAFTDGLPMSKGYPGSLYFRNTPTIINARHRYTFYWDGRMSGDDMPSMIRDHISEAHFMQADGRLVIERLRQVPYYEEEFKKVFGREPSYGKILNALSAFVASQNSDSPLDKYLRGDAEAISESAKRGLLVFGARAKCYLCHRGAMISDEMQHNIGVAGDEAIFVEPERHITFRRFFRTIGVPDYAILRRDIGCGCVTKNKQDRGKFRTPSLREVARTAPYMHNGSIPDLEGVIEFYNRGGGPNDELEPLGLSDQEKSDLLALLHSMSSPNSNIQPVDPPPYELRELGAN